MIVEKLEKVIFYPSSNLCLKHQVCLGEIDRKSKCRRNETSLYRYNINKYSDIDEVVKINLNTNDYLVLEILNVDKNLRMDANIFISYPHIIFLKKVLDEALSWFDEDSYNDLFVEYEDKIILNNVYSNLMVQSYPLISGRTIIIRPEIIETDNMIEEGIRLYFTSTLTTTLTVLQLENLYDFLERFDLYSSSQNLVNYYMMVMNNQNINLPVDKYHQQTMKEKIQQKERRSIQIRKKDRGMDDE